MPFENWIVEEEITPGPELDVRAVYIRLLQQVIDSLKEPNIPLTELVEPTFSIPTVIFAFLDTESLNDSAMAQLICYRDRREFLKELATYGEEDYLKHYGLKNFIGRKDMPDQTD